MAQQEDLKVCVESLHSNGIKEINYEGEEILQEKPTVSQRLTELAQRVDFTDSIESEGSEPPPKKSTQKWPWESPHSKLKQALTEISVLSDVLQITQNHRQYVALDAVLSNPMSAPSPTQQFIVKKKALEKAADILQRGTVSLSKSSTCGEKEFHQTLSNMRQRWRLRRLPNGAIVGDLGYHSAGSLLRSVFFEVSKGEMTDTQSPSEADVLQVTVPRELRGKSEIVVFISEQPVEDVPNLSSLPPSPVDHLTRHRRKDTPAWEVKLLEAQNVLFNQELFSQIAKEAYNQKPHIQHQVCSNRINVPLSSNCWLSILHVRDYEGSSLSSSNLPDKLIPRWSLVIALKQLLREKHHKVSTLNKPHPATVGFSEHARVSNASVVPCKAAEIRELIVDLNIFNLFVEKAKHCHNEELVHDWMSELCSTCTDPLLHLSWTPSQTLSVTVFTITLTSPTEPTARYTVTVTLKVDKLSVKQLDGETITYSVERDNFICALRHQILLHQMHVACSVAEGQKWNILQQFDRPILSPYVIKSNADYMMACSLTIQSPNAHKKLDVVLEWEGVSVSLTQFADNVVSSTDDIGSVAPKSMDIALDSQLGQNFQQRFYSLLRSLKT